MIEFHIYTEVTPKYEQAHVFIVDRDEEDFVEMKELYSIVVQGEPGEVKMRLNLSGIFRAIVDTPGGNVDVLNTDTITRIFGDLIPNEIKQQIEAQAQEYKEADEFAQMLIRGAEAAQSAHPITTDIDEIIKNLAHPK